MEDRLRKIRADVEIWFNESLRRAKITDTDYYNGKADAYRNVLTSIDEMEEEPVSEDLEDAVNNALERMLDKYGLVGTGSCLEMFKLGANWQKEQIVKENMLLPFKEYDNLMESINKKKKEGYEAGYKQGLIDSKSEQKPTLDIEIPFDAKDSELIEETISIPEGCYVIIKDNKIVIRKELCHQD